MTPSEQLKEEIKEYQTGGWNVLRVCFWVATTEIIIVLFALKGCLK